MKLFRNYNYAGDPVRSFHLIRARNLTAAQKPRETDTMSREFLVKFFPRLKYDQVGWGEGQVSIVARTPSCDFNQFDMRGQVFFFPGS